MTEWEKLHYALLKSEAKVKQLEQRLARKDEAYKWQGKACYDMSCKYERLKRKHLRLADIVMNVTSKGRRAKAMENMLHLIEQRDNFYDKYNSVHAQLRAKAGELHRLEKEHAKCKS